jgi:hypothetical protein
MTYAVPSQLSTPMMTTPMMGTPGLQPQQSVVGATALAVLLENPDLLDSLISGIGKVIRGFGDLLARRGGPRLRLSPPPSASPAAGVPAAYGIAMPLQAVPVTQPQAAPSYLAVPTQPQQGLPSLPEPAHAAPTTPSPQSEFAHGHRLHPQNWFRKWRR